MVADPRYVQYSRLLHWMAPAPAEEVQAQEAEPTMTPETAKEPPPPEKEGRKGWLLSPKRMSRKLEDNLDEEDDTNSKAEIREEVEETTAEYAKTTPTKAGSRGWKQRRLEDDIDKEDGTNGNVKINGEVEETTGEYAKAATIRAPTKAGRRGWIFRRKSRRPRRGAAGDLEDADNWED